MNNVNKIIGLVRTSSPGFRFKAAMVAIIPLVQELTAIAFLAFKIFLTLFSNFIVVGPLVTHPDLITLLILTVHFIKKRFK